MAVAYNDRDIPLNADAGNPLTTGLTLAYDFTGVDSRAEGAAYESSGTPTLVKTGTINQVTLNGIPGRKANAISLYEYTNTTDYGLQVGTGDWTIAVLFSTGASLPSTFLAQGAFEVRNAGGTVLASIGIEENSGTGWYLNATGTQGLGSSAGAVFYGTNKTVCFFLTRRSGIVSGWTMLAEPTATLSRRFNDGASNTTNWDSSSATRVRACYNANVSHVSDVTNHGVKFWAAGLTNDQMRDVGRDWFALDENTAAADEITITSPASSATIPTTTTISGTYVYNSGAPSSIEVQQGAGSWVALTSFSAAGGNWSGSITLSAGSSQTIRARDAVTTTIVSPDVTGLTIQADAIAFTAQNYGTYGNLQAVASRMFQRNGSNQTPNVRIVGTYVGSPTTIEWRYNGSAWATLDATPAAGVFDETVTLQGPAQGSLEVRFSNNNAVNASLSNVGVGDVYLCMGQSNHVGAAGSYVIPVAPGANPGWVPTKFGKDHVWRPIAETVADKFDDETPVYSAFSGAASPGGSYFGSLGTLIMDTGVPAAFVPCAKGSTSIDNWGVGAPVTNTSTLFGAAASTALLIGDHTAVLWQQGEAEGAGVGDPALLADKLDAIIDQWTTTVGTPWYVNIPPFSAMGSDADATIVRAELSSMPGLNTAVLAAIDLDGDYTGIHYDTPTQINNVAASVFAAMPYAADVTPPVLTGSVTFTFVSETGFTANWPIATDDVAVASYETSLDASNWTNRGPVNSHVFTGLSPGTSYTVYVRAKDVAANVSSPPIQGTQSTDAAPAPAPVSVGGSALVGVTQAGALAAVLSVGGSRAVAMLASGELVAIVARKGTSMVGIRANGQLVAILAGAG